MHLQRSVMSSGTMEFGSCKATAQGHADLAVIAVSVLQFRTGGAAMVYGNFTQDSGNVQFQDCTAEQGPGCRASKQVCSELWIQYSAVVADNLPGGAILVNGNLNQSNGSMRFRNCTACRGGPSVGFCQCSVSKSPLQVRYLPKKTYHHQASWHSLAAGHVKASRPPNLLA